MGIVYFFKSYIWFICSIPLIMVQWASDGMDFIIEMNAVVEHIKRIWNIHRKIFIDG